MSESKRALKLNEDVPRIDQTMASLAATATAHRRIKSLILVAIIIVVALAMVAGFLVHHYWPFTETEIRNRLAEDTGASVRFGTFRATYFPLGCVAENVTFTRNESTPPLASVRRLTVTSSLAGLFRHHVSTLRAEGMHVLLGRADFSHTGSGQTTIVDKLIADDAVLEVKQRAPAQPLRFVFHQFRLENLGGSVRTKFAAVLDIPLPAGLVRTSGQFGPWNSSDPAATTIEGKYSLENADLGVFHSIAGKISSSGDFNGSVKQIAIEGTTRTPEFEIADTGHKIPLQTRFSATVNATNGDTLLRRVKANFGRDEIEAHGSIARRVDGKRTAVVELNCERGRIEDTFYPFISSPQPPLTGNVVFQMHVVIPSGEERFLKKIQLNSDFRIMNAEFTNSETESRLSKISTRPHERERNETVAQMQGKVSVTNGVAQLSSLQVEDGGASAQFHGSYSLLNYRVNMHGKLTTQASLTKTTSGIRAAFAKVLEPLFKKRQHENVVPVRISGTYHHPNFGLDIGSAM